jgi:hypothetical protein
MELSLMGLGKPLGFTEKHNPPALTPRHARIKRPTPGPGGRHLLWPCESLTLTLENISYNCYKYLSQQLLLIIVSPIRQSLAAILLIVSPIRQSLAVLE